MRTTVPILAALLALAACRDSEPATPPTVRLAAVAGRPAAGYFNLDIVGDRGALLSVTSPQAGRIEMHETMTEGNMTSMRPIARIAVRHGERVVFAPGGRHLMIYDLAPGVAAGGNVTLIFHFERGEDVRLGALVTPAGGEAH